MFPLLLVIIAPQVNDILLLSRWHVEKHGQVQNTGWNSVENPFTLCHFGNGGRGGGGSDGRGGGRTLPPLEPPVKR